MRTVLGFHNRQKKPSISFPISVQSRVQYSVEEQPLFLFKLLYQVHDFATEIISFNIKHLKLTTLYIYSIFKVKEVSSKNFIHQAKNS